MSRGSGETANPRVSVKRAAESLLVRAGAARLGRALHRRDVAVVAYHNVLPDGAAPAGERSLHLSRRAFARQLDRLARTHRIISLEELGRSSDGAGPSAVITFDDAYVGAVTIGVEELARRGLPGTIFVVPELLGRRSFWWDRLASGDSGRLPDAARQRAIEDLGGRDEAVREWSAAGGPPERELPEYCLSATEEELARSLDRPGITVASHTWSHPNLATIPASEAEEELVRSRDWLAGRFPDRWIPWLSYPYGRFDAEVERAASRWYEGALRIEGGLSTPSGIRSRPHAVPRVNIPAGVSARGFELRVSGILAR